MGNIMPTDTTSVGTTPCVLEPRREIWDLRGEMTATFADKSNPKEPVGFIAANQTLLVTVTVTLKGRIRYYLCDTTLCVNLAFEACGCGPSGDLPCQDIVLCGPNSPCQKSEWEFPFEIKPGTLTTGDCGREYTLCITLGSKDCCGKVGFIFGSCHDFTITVVPAETATVSPLEADTVAPAETG
jgi:hypothetical protein